MNGVLFSSRSGVWLSDPRLLDVVRRFGAIGLDPCAHRLARVEAAVEWYGGDGGDGLVLPWGGLGLVYANPPYGRAMPEWITKARREAAAGVEILLLCAARTDTVWFRDSGAAAVCFLTGRQRFFTVRRGNLAPVGHAPFPSALLYYGRQFARFYYVFQSLGVVVPWPPPRAAVERIEHNHHNPKGGANGT